MRFSFLVFLHVLFLLNVFFTSAQHDSNTYYLRDTMRLNRIAFGLSKDEKSVDKLAKRIKDSCSTELEKIYTIYTYIASTYIYDIDRLKLIQKGALKRELYLSELLTKKKGTCGDFSNLFQAICSKADVSCFRVVGHAKTASLFHPIRRKKYNHAWNVVRLDDQWYPLDVTWGIKNFTIKKYNRKKVNYAFFLIDPEEFGKSHLPADPTFQLVNPQRSYRSFRFHHFKPGEGEQNRSSDFNSILTNRLKKDWKDALLEEAHYATVYNPDARNSFLSLIHFAAERVIDKKADRKGNLKKNDYQEAIYLYQGLRIYAQNERKRRHKRLDRYIEKKIETLETEKNKLKK